MIWSELGATFPLAGGTYNFLKESFGPKWGRLMSFLFVWQTMIQAPLVIASAAIGFAQYLTYIVPLDEVERKIISGSVVVLIIFYCTEKLKPLEK
jgi:amino acid transporter